jgi:hypothetical protein
MQASQAASRTRTVAAEIPADIALIKDHSFVFQQLMLQDSEEEAYIPSHTRAQTNMLKIGDGKSRL